MLVAGMVSFGLILCKANITQQAADVGAQELARMVLSPVNTITSGNENGYLDDVLYSTATDPASPAYQVRQQIFDEQYLYVPVANMANKSLFDYSANWPLMNRLMATAMIFDSNLQAYRYPGAVVTNQAGKTTVLVPLVIARDPNTGIETIEWHRPVEEVKFQDSAGNWTIGQYSIAASGATGPSAASFTPGVVALRIYCPVETPMVAAQPNPANVPGTAPLPNLGYQIEASDAGVTVTDPYDLMQKYSLVVPPDSNPGSPVGGEYGMGSLRFSAEKLTYQTRNVPLVRPFRKVVVAQGVYRREVFGP
jgi:hypothetical protein